jgi:hypothetical protein
LIVNVTVEEVPPPGAGLVTATFADPVFAMSAAGIKATSCDELINAVARKLPFQTTKEVAVKPDPLTLI